MNQIIKQVNAICFKSACCYNHGTCLHLYTIHEPTNQTSESNFFSISKTCLLFVLTYPYSKQCKSRSRHLGGWEDSPLRWPTTVTSKPNAHIKFKSLTSNSNRSQQIQITHSKIKITHSKLQIAHSKFKSPTANSNRSQQIKVAHSKFKLLTANYNLLTPLGVFGYLQPAVQLV